MTDRATVIHNERIKLRAAWFNTMAASTFAVGVLAPIATSFYGFAADHVPVHTVIAGIVVWFGGALWLHRRAWGTLEELK